MGIREYIVSVFRVSMVQSWLFIVELSSLQCLSGYERVPTKSKKATFLLVNYELYIIIVEKRLREITP